MDLDLNFIQPDQTDPNFYQPTHAFTGNNTALAIDGDYVYGLDSNTNKLFRIKGDFSSPVYPQINTILSSNGLNNGLGTCYTRSTGAEATCGMIVQDGTLILHESKSYELAPTTGLYMVTGVNVDTGAPIETVGCGGWLYADNNNPHPTYLSATGNMRVAPDGRYYQAAIQNAYKINIWGALGTAEAGMNLGLVTPLSWPENGTSSKFRNYDMTWVPTVTATVVSGVVLDSNTSGINCDAYIPGKSFTWKVLSTGENGVGTVGTGGAISFTVNSTGVSDVCIKVDGALSVKAESVTLSGNVNVGNLYVMLPDILNDDIWDDFDLNEVNGGFGSTVTPGSGADYNCDGLYDDFDLNQVNGGFGSTGACFGL